MSASPLDRDRVVAEALALTDGGGLGALSSRALADRLGVTPMALYRHVRNMDDLVAEVVDRRLADLGTPDADLPWQAWFEAFAHELRALFEREPDALALFTRQPVTSPAARRRLRAGLDVLRSAGFHEDGALAVYAAVHTYVIGFSALEAGRRRAAEGPGPEPEGTDDDEGELADRIRGFVTPDVFQRGLRALIAGLDPTGA